MLNMDKITGFTPKSLVSKCHIWFRDRRMDIGKDKRSGRPSILDILEDQVGDVS